MSNYTRNVFTFHDAETSTSADGNELVVGGYYDTLQLEAESTGTCTLIFEGCGTLGVWRPIIGAEMTADITLLTEATDLTVFYQIDLSGVSKVRIRLESNTGTTTVAGKIVG